MSLTEGVSGATGALSGLGGTSFRAVAGGIRAVMPGIGKSSDGKKKHWWGKSKSKET